MYKTLAFLLLLGCAFGRTQAERTAKEEVLQFAPRVLEDIIRQVSDCLRETLNEGDESIGLPSCNPLQLEDDTLNFDLLGIEEYIRGSVTGKNVYVEGITSWEITELSDQISIIPIGYILTFALYIPGISGKASYDGNITVFDQYNIYGAGDIEAGVKNVQISGKATIGISGGINIKSLELQFGIETIELSITGLLNDEVLSKLLSDFVTNELVNYITTYQDELNAAISDLVKYYVNKLLQSDIEIDNEIIEGIIKKCIPL